MKEIDSDRFAGNLLKSSHFLVLSLEGLPTRRETLNSSFQFCWASYSPVLLPVKMDLFKLLIACFLLPVTFRGFESIRCLQKSRFNLDCGA